MSVKLGCRNVRMSQKFLHNAQIRAVFQQMRRKAMSERVRRNVFVNLFPLLMDKIINVLTG